MKKNIKIILIFLIPVSYFVYLHFKGRATYHKFYHENLKHKVIRRDNGQLRTTVFYLENDVEIDSFGIEGYMYDLKIDDSIVKEANSQIFKVYRKDEYKKYSLIYTYDYEPIYF